MKYAVIFLLSSVLSTVALARWADPSIANYTTEDMKQEIDVKEDGTFVMNGEATIQLLSEAAIGGRNQFNQIYSRASEKFEILEAETLVGGKSIPVPEEMIEDKSVASSGNAIEDLHQVTITFPSLVKGAKVHFRFRATRLQMVAPGNFSYLSSFGVTESIKKWVTTIKAPFPLFLESNNPGKMFEFKASQNGKSHQLTMKLKAPYFRAVVEEDSMLTFPEELPWIHVSNTKDWSAPFQQVISGFETEIAKPLPSAFEEILQAAKKVPPGPKQLNLITDMLGDRTRYMSDTRRMEGLLTPRRLQDVVNTGYGDCKDMATAIVAIARRLGYDAKIAIIELSANRTTVIGELPSMGLFNHAIARVKIGDKVYWLDGTSRTSFAEGIFTEWQDRQALVLDAKKPVLEFIHSMPSSKSRWVVSKEYVLDPRNPKVVQFKATLLATGNYGNYYVGLDRRQTQETTKYQVLNRFEDISKVQDYKFEPFNLQSRSNHDVKFSVSGTLNDPFLRSTGGTYYNWNAGNEIEKLMQPVRNRVTNLDLDMKSELDYDFLFRNARLVGKPVHCKVSSPWFEGTRNISQEKDGLRMQDKIVIKTDYVSNRDLHSQPYQEFQGRLRSCFSSLGVLFKIVPGKAPKQQLSR